MNAPLRPAILFWYGRLLTRLKRRSAALEAFRQVTREVPRHRQAWSCMGFLLAEREQFDSAIEAFEHARALDARDAPSHFNIGFLLQRVNRHEQALEQAAAVHWKA